MTIEEAETLLNTATRLELRDHAFGDIELTWVIDVPANQEGGKVLAWGYLGITNYVDIVDKDGAPVVKFYDEDAHRLRKAGAKVIVQRNDGSQN